MERGNLDLLILALVGSAALMSLQSPIHIVGEPKRHVRPPPLLVGHQHSRTRKVAPRSS
jgi:hypothetical protein